MRDRPSNTHRRAAEQKLGRPIKPGHDIDHLNENKDDNSPANLVERSHGEHTAKSNRSRTLAQLQKALAMVRKGQKSY